MAKNGETKSAQTLAVECPKKLAAKQFVLHNGRLGSVLALSRPLPNGGLVCVWFGDKTTSADAEQRWPLIELVKLGDCETL